MKTLKSILLVILVALVSFAQAQKVFKVTDVIDGKTILQHAQKIDAAALVQTKDIYKPGMSEATFINELQKGFPPEASSIKPLFNPYFKYVYTMQKKGLTDIQVKGTTTGVELAALCTDLNAWNANNQGGVSEIFKFNWKKALEFIVDIIIVIISFI